VGCDPAFTWDGRANDGSLVPRGVYLIRLRAGGTQSVKKAVFQGP
jgi:flagellar hook assembly protein FlgD